MRAAAILLALALGACAAPEPGSSPDPVVSLKLSNSGSRTLHCRLIYGHWTERDLGELKPAGLLTIELQQQQQDGALYVLRDDGKRRLMVENVFCAAVNDWQATVGQVDLAKARQARPREIEVSCALPGSGGRVACAAPTLRPAED